MWLKRWCEEYRRSFSPDKSSISVTEFGLREQCIAPAKGRVCGELSQKKHDLLDSMAAPESQSAAIQQHLLDNLHLPHSVASLAERVNMSPRNLTRVFTRDCGVGPMTFLTNARLDAARRFLETTDVTIREVARRCGFDSADNMRRAFHKHLQIHPADYRQRFLTGNELGTSKARRA
ncbi:helix-turn-helix domain-containing protein [Cupriavidus plantarum]|uniref:helix-turn-helix domain-containing protein n=1 Tax=Cupriavidus plantarum TaxID=942865 RepID=UPI00339D6D22